MKLLLLLALSAAVPDVPATRETAMARVQELNTALLSRPSATATLQAWCDLAHPGAKIVARQVKGAERVAGPAERADLQVKDSEPTRYRRVQLACADQVLSEADNWYLPGHLTPEMNRILETTETPFGVVVRPLDFRRRTLRTDLLIRPGHDWPWHRWTLPAEILRHRAVLSTPDGQVFSLVVETYQDDLIGP